MSDIEKKDRELFREAVGAVRPMRDNHLHHPHPPPKPGLLEPHSSLPDLFEEVLRDLPENYELQPGDVLSYARPGTSRQILRRLRRGQFRIDAELDLHGLNLRDARRSLLEFLHEHHRKRLGCVRIIHGKGWRSGNQGPVLKPAVNEWLRQLDEVLAFVSARPADGGTGALYVLLRAHSSQS